MGRTNKSHRRRMENAKVKKARYAVKELAMLKKTLGIMETDDNETMEQQLSEVATVKTAKEIKKASFYLFIVNRKYSKQFSFTCRIKNPKKKNNWNTNYKKNVKKVKLLQWSTRKRVKLMFTIQKPLKINMVPIHPGINHVKQQNVCARRIMLVNLNSNNIGP